MLAKVSEIEKLCCHQLSPSRRRLLRKCSPHRQPHLWLLLNFIILIWSVVLLIRFVGSQREEKIYVELQYLIYNFGTCLVWVVEVGLNIFDFIDSKEGESGEQSLLQQQQQQQQQQPEHSIATTNETLPLWIEFSLAVFFLVNSVGIVFHLTRKEVHHEAKGALVDVLVAVFAYLFMIYRQFVDMRQTNVVENEQIISAAAAEADSGGEIV